MRCNSDAAETPHFSSITRPHLAQETINQILGNLEGDIKTLIACTLTSRLFLHSAWSELYRTCTLELPAKRPLKWKGEAEPPVFSSTDKAGTEHPLVLFARFLAAAQHAPSHIKQLRISAKKNNERQSPMALHHLHYILSLLPKLESLCLEQVSIYMFSQVANALDETISTPPRHRYHLQHLALLDTNLHTFLEPGQSELLFDLFDTFERVDSLELKTNEFYSYIKDWPRQPLSLDGLREHDRSRQEQHHTTSFDCLSTLISSNLSAIHANMISWPSHTGLKRLVSDHGSEMMAFQLHMMPAMMFYLGPQLVNPSFKFPVRKPYIIDLSNCPKLELVSIHLEVTPSQFEMADYYFMTTYMGDMLQTLPKDTPSSSSPEIPTINRRLLLLVDLTNMDLPTLRTKFGEEEFFNWEKLDKSFEAFGKLNIWLRFKTIKASRPDYRRGILPPPKVTIESLDDPEILDIFTKNLPSLNRFEDVFGGDPVGNSEA